MTHKITPIKTVEEAKSIIQSTHHLFYVKLDSENLIGRISPMSETYEDDLVILVKNKVLYSTQKDAKYHANIIVNMFN